LPKKASVRWKCGGRTHLTPEGVVEAFWTIVFNRSFISSESETATNSRREANELIPQGHLQAMAP